MATVQEKIDLMNAKKEHILAGGGEARCPAAGGAERRRRPQLQHRRRE